MSVEDIWAGASTLKLFDFEEERVKREILRLDAKRVLIQLPDGLKPEAFRLAKIVEKLGVLPIVSADPCYGACDVASTEALALGADLVVHYGHSKRVRHEPVPTVYVEARATVTVDEAVEKAVELLTDWRRIGLATTIQHVQTLDAVREILTRAGKTVIVGDAGRLEHPGQVLGCDYSNVKSIAEDVEAFLFVGGGRFHAIGIALSTSKPTIVADPYDWSAYSVNVEAEKILKQRWAAIAEAKKAKTWAILVGLKSGQKRLDEALHVKSRLEMKRKIVVVFAVREITPEAIMQFPSADAFVNTACPRVSIDDALRFQKPVLTPAEALMVNGDLTWEELCRRGLFES